MKKKKETIAKWTTRWKFRTWSQSGRYYDSSVVCVPFFSFCRSPFWTVDRKKDVVAPRRRRQLIRVVSSFCGRSSTAPRCREQQHQGDAADDHPKKTAATTTTMRDKSPGNRPAHPFPNWLFFPSFFGCWWRSAWTHFAVTATAAEFDNKSALISAISLDWT